MLSWLLSRAAGFYNIIVKIFSIFIRVLIYLYNILLQIINFCFKFFNNIIKIFINVISKDLKDLKDWQRFIFKTLKNPIYVFWIIFYFILYILIIPLFSLSYIYFFIYWWSMIILYKWGIVEQLKPEVTIISSWWHICFFHNEIINKGRVLSFLVLYNSLQTYYNKNKKFSLNIVVISFYNLIIRLILGVSKNIIIDSFWLGFKTGLYFKHISLKNWRSIIDFNNHCVLNAFPEIYLTYYYKTRYRIFKTLDKTFNFNPYKFSFKTNELSSLIKPHIPLFKEIIAQSKLIYTSVPGSWSDHVCTYTELGNIEEKDYIILNNLTKSNKIVPSYVIGKSYIINNQFLYKEDLKFKLVPEKFLKIQLIEKNILTNIAFLNHFIIPQSNFFYYNENRYINCVFEKPLRLPYLLQMQYKELELNSDIKYYLKELDQIFPYFFFENFTKVEIVKFTKEFIEIIDPKNGEFFEKVEMMYNDGEVSII